jgi:hypothetical protein
MIQFYSIAPSFPMGRAMKRFVSIVLMSLGSAMAAAENADGPKDIPLPPTGVAVEKYGETNLACVSWTDGCRTCQRGANALAVCSNVGTACLPRAISCPIVGTESRSGQ